MIKIHNEVFLVLIFKMGNGSHSMYKKLYLISRCVVWDFAVRLKE